MGSLRCFPGFLVALACGGVLSCGSGDTSLAKVGDARLEIAPFQKYVGDVSGETWQGVSARVTSRLLDQYLDRQVVLEVAQRREVISQTESMSLGPTEMRWLVDELCGPSPDADQAAIDLEVSRKMEETLPAQAHVRQVLVDSLEEALAARQRLSAGEDFVEISRELSRAPNAADGGELGFFYEGSLPPEIDEVIFSLSEGEISEPVQGPSGYHVFQVLEVVPSGPPNEVEVNAAVGGEFAEEAARTHKRDCVERLAEEIGVAVNSNQLWFSYDGKYAEEREHA